MKRKAPVFWAREEKKRELEERDGFWGAFSDLAAASFGLSRFPPFSPPVCDKIRMDGASPATPVCPAVFRGGLLFLPPPHNSALFAFFVKKNKQIVELSQSRKRAKYKTMTAWKPRNAKN